MLARIKDFVNPALEKFKSGVKKHQADIVLLIGVILISLFSFALGYIVAKQQEKEPLRIERNATKYEFSYEHTKTDLKPN